MTSLIAGLLAGFTLASPTTLLSTNDGSQVALQRRPGAGSPVLLVHGLSSNHHSFDLHGRGLAADLQADGYDVWMLDLRGRGASASPPGRPQWTLDDYGRHDVAAAIDHIRLTTGQPRVAYVGHSMGGMVLSIYHHWHGGAALGPCVVLGSPLIFEHPDPLLRMSTHSMAAGSILRKVPSQAAARAAAVLPRTRRVDRMLFNPGATSSATRRAMYRSIVSPMTSAELDHLGQIVQSGRLVSADGTIDYVASLEDWSAPLLVVAGRVDQIAPPDRVAAWLDYTAASDTTWWVAGRSRSYPEDYGHLDLILADDVSAELHRDILTWLSEQPWSGPSRAP